MGQRVSVIMPIYLGERHIEEAVRSALAQSHDDLEVIVVDDGSPDASAEIVAGIEDARIKLIRQPNQGVAGARNAGIAASSGDFIAFLDQDDVWNPEKLSAQLPSFADPGVAAVGSLMTYLGPSGPLNATSGEIADDQQERIAAARLMPFAPSSMIIRAQALRAVGGFDQKLAADVGPVDDLDVISRIARIGRVLTVRRSLGFYRIHAEAGTFAKFYEMQRATRYLQDRMETHQTWEEWSNSNNPSASERRYDKAKFHYRSAGLLIASGRRVAGLSRLAASFFASPRYVVTRLRRQLG